MGAALGLLLCLGRGVPEAREGPDEVVRHHTESDEEEAAKLHEGERDPLLATGGIAVRHRCRIEDYKTGDPHTQRTDRLKDVAGKSRGNLRARKRRERETKKKGKEDASITKNLNHIDKHEHPKDIEERDGNNVEDNNKKQEPAVPHHNKGINCIFCKS